MGGPIKLDTILNEQIDLEEIQKQSQGRFKKNDKVKERLNQALKDQKQCQNIIQSIEDNALTQEDLEEVLACIQPLQEKKVSFGELSKLQSLSTIPSLFQKIVTALNIKGMKSKSLEQVSESIFEKLLAPSFKATKKLTKVLEDNIPEIMDKQLQNVYSMVLGTEFSYEKQATEEEEQQQEVQEQVEEKQIEEVQQQPEEEEEEFEEIEKPQKKKKTTKKQQKQAVPQRKSRRHQIQKPEEEQQQEEVPEIEQEQEQKQESIEQEEKNTEMAIEQEIPEQKSQENQEQQQEQLEEGEVMEIEIQQEQQQQEVVEQQQEQEQVAMEQEIPQEPVKEVELPEDVTTLPTIDVANFTIFEEKLEKKVKATKQKKKKAVLEKQLKIVKLSIELSKYLSEENQNKHTKTQLVSYQEQIQSLGLNCGWMQCLVISDLVKEIESAEERINSLYEETQKDFQPQEQQGLHEVFLNCPKKEFSEVQDQLDQIFVDFQKFDLTENQELAQKSELIDQAVHLTKMASQEIKTFFREVNLNSMNEEDSKVVENRIIDTQEKINAAPFQIKEDNKQFLYKTWLFACICQQKKFRQGDINDWKELKQCSEIYGEEADQRFVKMIERQFEFQSNIDEFSSNISEKSIDSIEEMIETSKTYLIQTTQAKEMEQIISQIKENQEEFSGKLFERLTCKEWKDVQKGLSNGIPIQYKELQQVQKIIENIEKFDKELPTLKKEKNKEVIQQHLQTYLSQNFKHPEYEKLIKKHKTQENDLILLQRKVNFLTIEYSQIQEIEEEITKTFEKSPNEELQKQLKETLFLRKIDLLVSSQTPLMAYKELKEMYQGFSIKMGTDEENLYLQPLKKIESCIKAIEYELLIIEEPSKETQEQNKQFRNTNKKCVNYEEELTQQKKKREEYEKFLKEQQKEKDDEMMLDRPYDPRVDSISTKKVSEKATKYKTQFITRLSKYLELNKNWKIDTQQSVTFAQKIANRLYTHLQNSDRVVPIGERIITCFKMLHSYPRISKQLISDNFPLIQILSLKDKSEKEIQAKELNKPIQKSADTQNPNQEKLKKKIKTNEGSQKVVNRPEQQQQQKEIKNAKASSLKQPPASFFNKSRDVSTDNKVQKKQNYKQARQESLEEKYIDLIDKKSVSKAAATTSQNVEKKKKIFPRLSEMELNNTTDEDNSITLDNSFENDRLITQNNCDGRILRVFNGPMDNDTNQLQQISFMSTNTFSSLSALPIRASKGFVSIKETCKFQKFRDYLDLILKDTSKNRNLVNFGWVESELFNHNQALQQWGYKLRNSSRTAIIQWANECKIYVIHKESLTQKWKSQFKYSENNFCFNDSNLVWISIYKKYKAIASPKIVPEVIPEDQQIYKAQQQQKQEILQKQILESNYVQQQQQQQLNDNSLVNDTYSTYSNKSNFNKNNNNNNNVKQNYNKQSTNKFRPNYQQNNNNNFNNNRNNNYIGQRSVSKFSTKKSVGKSVGKQNFNNSNNNNNNNQTQNNMNQRENYIANKYSTTKQIHHNNNNNNRQQNFNNNNNRQRSQSTKKFVNNNQNNFNNNRFNNNNNNNNKNQQIQQVLNNIQSTLGQLTAQKSTYPAPAQNNNNKQAIPSFANSELMETVRQQQEQIELLKMQNQLLNTTSKNTHFNNNNNHNRNRRNKFNNKKNRANFFNLPNNQASLMETDCEDSFDDNASVQKMNNYSQQMQNGGNILSQTSYMSQQMHQQQQQQMQQQQPVKTENMFLRQVQQPQRVPLIKNQQQESSVEREFTGLTDVTSQHHNKENIMGQNQQSQEDIPNYLKQKLQSTYNFPANNPHRQQSNFSYSTNMTNKSYQAQHKDNRFMTY